ncbi:hypothetical protein [Ramlibacter sp. Leaf400]|uniref:hypothetical protein n=1 Tax=Ramlibacter sp. Leaf400 TaxID=1736365 RepID=UPI0006FA8686|nr:hypothetical protein [Ramlibacter sp. Leaf400]KQT09321.1 hypothetical protein ASG30_12120 [Ramlibacter sp. Leaf400]
MTEQELDVAYTALCRALGEAGPANAERFLAMMCLGLMVRCEQPQEVLALIESVRGRCADEAE